MKKWEVVTNARTGDQRGNDGAIWWWILLLAAVSVAVLVVAKGRTRVDSTSVPPQHRENNSADEVDKKFTVLRVKDGDTIVVVGRDGVTFDVRLAGIDAPELDQPFGSEAKSFLQQLLSHQKSVTLQLKGREKFGRVLADVYLDALCINFELAAHGYAWVYDNPSPEILGAQDRARREKKGLWASVAPVEPRTWRANKTAEKVSPQ